MSNIAHKPLISVLITYYNQKKYVQRALQSVLDQTYDNIEIVLGDDCSSDDYARQLTDQHAEVTYLRQKSNVGRRDHYRLLLARASGVYATILNADDFFTDVDYIKKAVHLLESYGNMHLVFGKTDVYLEQINKIIYDSNDRSLDEVMDGGEFLLKMYPIPHVTSIYNRKLAIDLDFYRSNYMSQDWESLLRICQEGKVGYIKSPSALYGRHSDNVSKSIDIGLLINSAEHIEGPYQHALQKGVISTERLNQWRDKMLFKFYSKCYVKVSLWEPEKKIELLNKLSGKYPYIAQQLKSDIKIKAFNAIKSSDLLLKLVFKYYLKQPSVIEDFLQFRN